MWPQALQMSREECRGILRRLELESYSNVISVFRAQGGLSETKAKVLEELRNLFHISQERHRAEARRVANDEQLSTIAEAISGPNTWQEWSREGRRSFPMLPRVAPQTALALIANNIANEVATENAKLPYPAETGIATADEQSVYAAAKAANKGHERNANYIVANDPFKMPEIPAATKKNLKRNISDHNVATKKRLITENASLTKLQQQNDKYNYVKHTQLTQLTTPPSNIRKLYNSHIKMQPHHQQMQQNANILQQQQPQHKITKKAKAQKNSNQSTGVTKRQITPAKVGRRSHKMQQHELQLQQQQQQGSYISNLPQQPQPGPSMPADLQHVDILGDIKDTTTSLIVPQSPVTGAATTILPPKKELPKIFTKLQTPTSPTTAARLIPLEITQHQQQQPTINILHSPTINTQLLNAAGKIEKQTLISTPVQKYIVEERQPTSSPLSPVAQLHSTITATGSILAPQSTISTAPQIMTLPQISGSSTAKLRTVNTSILTPQTGTKIATKKLTNTLVQGTVPMQLESPTSTATQSLYNIVEPSGGAIPNPPTHTVPAIIQLQSSDPNATAPTTATQGKVLTTKLMPIVLSGSGTSNAKLENVNASNVPAGTIIKSLPASMLITGTQMSNNSNVSSVSGVVNSSGSQIISTLAPGTTIFRKAGNIFKGAKPPNPGGPQILSNIKLTPVTTTSTTQSTFLKNISTTGLRTSVKICQSSNGKVFIQPAHLTDATKAKLQTSAGSLQHKLLPTSGSGVLSTNVSTSSTGTTTTPQRIAIQKVQIIPAPLNSPGGMLPQKPTSLTLTNKSNMIFVPASAATAVNSGRPITISKSNLLTAKNTTTGLLQSTQDTAKSNVVIIGSATTPTTPIKTPTTTSILYEQQANKPSSLLSNNNNQLITEDTPVDILSMPIIVEGADCSDVDNDIDAAESLTVLASEPQSATQQQHRQQNLEALEKVPTQQSMIVLGATDWEMELDQAQAQANATAATKSAQHRTQHVDNTLSTSVQSNNIRTTTSNTATNLICNDPIIIDHDSYHNDDIVVDAQSEELTRKSEDDVIILEDAKQNIIEYLPQTTTTTTTSLKAARHKQTSSNEDCYIVIDDKIGEAKYEHDRNSSMDDSVVLTELNSQNNNDLLETNDEENTEIEYIKNDKEMNVEKNLTKKKTVVITNIQTISTPLTTATANLNIKTTAKATRKSSFNDTLENISNEFNQSSIANAQSQQQTATSLFTLVENTATTTTTTTTTLENANSNNSNTAAINTNNTVNTQTVQ